MAADPQPDSQSDTDNNGSQMKKVRKHEPPINIQLWHLKKKEEKKKKTKIKHWPFTSSKIWTFADTPVTKSALHIAQAEVDWKGKEPGRKANQSDGDFLFF